jgi:hypothetical protein
VLDRPCRHGEQDRHLPPEDIGHTRDRRLCTERGACRCPRPT